jgi:hypothetical protein
MTDYSSAQAWLESQPPKAELDDVERVELLKLLGHPGMGALLSLMLGSRQAIFVSLSNTPLNSPSAVAQASVLQGRAQGIDLLRDTLLEQSHVAQAAEGAKDNSNG